MPLLADAANVQQLLLLCVNILSASLKLDPLTFNDYNFKSPLIPYLQNANETLLLKTSRALDVSNVQVHL